MTKEYTVVTVRKADGTLAKVKKPLYVVNKTEQTKTPRKILTLVQPTISEVNESAPREEAAPIPATTDVRLAMASNSSPKKPGTIEIALNITVSATLVLPAQPDSVAVDRDFLPTTAPILSSRILRPFVPQYCLRLIRR